MSDPYCMLGLITDEKEEEKIKNIRAHRRKSKSTIREVLDGESMHMTTVKENTLNPVWNETFMMWVASAIYNFMEAFKVIFFNKNNSMLAYRMVCCSHKSERRVRVCISHQSDHCIKVCISHQSECRIWISCTNHSVWVLCSSKWCNGSGGCAQRMTLTRNFGLICWV